MGCTALGDTTPGTHSPTVYCHSHSHNHRSSNIHCKSHTSLATKAPTTVSNKQEPRVVTEYCALCCRACKRAQIETPTKCRAGLQHPGIRWHAHPLSGPTSLTLWGTTPKRGPFCRLSHHPSLCSGDRGCVVSGRDGGWEGCGSEPEGGFTVGARAAVRPGASAPARGPEAAARGLGTLPSQGGRRAPPAFESRAVGGTRMVGLRQARTWTKKGQRWLQCRRSHAVACDGDR